MRSGPSCAYRHLRILFANFVPDIHWPKRPETDVSSKLAFRLSRTTNVTSIIEANAREGSTGIEPTKIRTRNPRDLGWTECSEAEENSRSYGGRSRGEDEAAEKATRRGTS